MPPNLCQQRVGPYGGMPGGLIHHAADFPWQGGIQELRLQSTCTASTEDRPPPSIILAVAEKSFMIQLHFFKSSCSFYYLDEITSHTLI